MGLGSYLSDKKVSSLDIAVSTATAYYHVHVDDHAQVDDRDHVDEYLAHC